MRKFHVDQFPQDRIFILLDKKFHKELFDYIHSRYKFGELNRNFFLNKLNENNYKRWKYRIKKPGRKIPQFIPLCFIIRISRIFNENFPLYKIEKHIIAYKGPSASSIIWDPKLPLMEDKRIMRILAHLIGDGHVGGAFGTGLPKGWSSSEYKNTHKKLISIFKKDLEVFGKVHTHYIKKDTLIIPNSIGYILRKLYNIKFDCQNSRVPLIFYDTRKELVARFIRAFCDDEGHVYDNHIDFYSTNKYLLLGIRDLINLKFPEIKISELKMSKRIKEHHYDKYYFYVLAESRENYLELIGFDHEKKRNDLIFNIRRSFLNKRSGKRGLTKMNILEFLNKENLSAKQISRKLYLSHGTILDHIGNLKENNKIIVCGKGHFNENIWKLV